MLLRGRLLPVHLLAEDAVAVVFEVGRGLRGLEDVSPTPHIGGIAPGFELAESDESADARPSIGADPLHCHRVRNDDPARSHRAQEFARQARIVGRGLRGRGEPLEHLTTGLAFERAIPIELLQRSGVLVSRLSASAVGCQSSVAKPSCAPMKVSIVSGIVSPGWINRPGGTRRAAGRSRACSRAADGAGSTLCRDR